MPGRRAKKPRAKVQFKVVQQSYEDKDYADKPKPVLVPVSALKPKKSRAPLFRFGEDVPEDFSEKRNMLMVNDEEDDSELRANGKVFFEDEVEEEFDNDFIKDMMFGTGAAAAAVGGDDDDDLFGEGADGAAGDADAEAAKYPKHDDLSGMLERQFAAMAKEFAQDEDIEEEDPRVQGALDIKHYAAALEEFVEEHAGSSYTSELPMKHRGLINQMKFMTRENGIFDMDKDGKGYFVTTLLPDKARRVNEEFHEGVQELKELTADLLRRRRQEEEEAAARRQQRAAEGGDAGDSDKDEPDDTPPEGKMFVTLKDKRMQHDCETVLSTYTTLFNHPNIIAASKKKMKLPSTGQLSQIAKAKEKEMEGVAKRKAKEAKAAAAGASPAEGGDVDVVHADPVSSDGPVASISAPAKPKSKKAPAAAAASKDVAGNNDDDDHDFDEEGEDEGDDFAGGSEGIMARAREMGIDLTVRHKDESPEEKKLRRQLVKQLQRERREAKKQLKTVYKALAIETSTTLPQQKAQKRMTSLSAVSYTK